MARTELPPGKKVPMRMPAMPDLRKQRPEPVTFVERQELLKAFLDVVDGETVSTLNRFRELGAARCEELIDIGQKCMAEYQHLRKQQ